MGKPGGSGGGRAVFEQNIFGPPPGDLTVKTLLWIELGSIPTGNKIWFGNAQYTSPDKSVTFELRTNITGQSTGTDANTMVLYKASVSPRKGTFAVDMYKNGRLHTVTVLGTGVEKYWLKLVSKGGSDASYLYNINYTVE